ncbi:MAG: hypothetical protein JW797_03370 [Bradymonadales bacterium]|nr:hypothetical protein [Bradymonadales bacterium]
MGILLRIVEWIGKGVSGGRYTCGIQRLAGVVVLVSLLSLCLSAALTEVEGNPASRLASIEALVDHGRWRIDDSVFLYVTVDKVQMEDGFYSSKPPLMAAAGAVCYQALSSLTGLSFEHNQRLVVALLRIAMQVLPFLCGLVLAGRFSAARLQQERVWLWGFLSLAMGTFLFGYSATINNHTLASLLVLASLIGTLRLGEERSAGWWLYLGTGLVTCGAVVLDFGAALFALGAAIYLVVRVRRPVCLWFFLGAALPALVHFHLTYRLTGSLLPFYGQDGLYDYPGSYWNRPRDFDALTEPGWVYAFHTLVGHHGLFSMTPLFCWSIPGIVTLMKSPTRKGEGWLIGTVCTATVAVYILLGPRNYGGTAMGMRWLFVLVPLLWYSALVHADRTVLSPRLWTLFKVSVGLGMVHALAALTGPWAVSPWNWLLRWLGLGSVPPYRRWLPG